MTINEERVKRFKEVGNFEEAERIQAIIDKAKLRYLNKIKSDEKLKDKIENLPVTVNAEQKKAYYINYYYEVVKPKRPIYIPSKILDEKQRIKQQKYYNEVVKPRREQAKIEKKI